MSSRYRTKSFIAGSSAGGHTNELLALLDAAGEIWPRMPDVYVTTLDIAISGFDRFGKPVRVIGEADRKKPLKALAVLYRTLKCVLSDRPRVIVTTGSMPLMVYCLWAKLLFRAHVVWIDSIAQVDQMSTSGKIMSRMADVCYSQWPEVAAHRPRVIYSGEVL